MVIGSGKYGTDSTKSQKVMCNVHLTLSWGKMVWPFVLSTFRPTMYNAKIWNLIPAQSTLQNVHFLPKLAVSINPPT